MPYTKGAKKTKKEAAWYLAALVDGEGCIHFSVGKKKRKGFRRHISITNTEESIIAACVECLEVLGLPFSIYDEQQGGRPVHFKPRTTVALTGGRQTFEKFRALVPIQSAAKRASLDALIASYEQLPWAKGRVWSPTREELHYEYVVLGKSMQQIANERGYKNNSAVHYWLRRLGVPTRSRSVASRRHTDGRFQSALYPG